MLNVSNLTVQYGNLTIVDDVSFSVRESDWLMIVGPNGAGKSTVVNAVSQGAPYSGRVFLSGIDVKKQKSSAVAREMGVLTQNHFVGYSFTVEEVVSLGRYAHSKGVFHARTGEDEQRIEEALTLTGMAQIRKQSVLTLSGGELQRTFLAQVFAQNPKLLILDEPTNHLDLKYQQQIFALIREWLKTPGRAVISVVHDLSLARAYGTQALLMNKGKLIACGDAQSVLDQERLRVAYEMDVYDWMRQMLKQWET